LSEEKYMAYDEVNSINLQPRFCQQVRNRR
jgi:hypothetical protein